MNTFCSIFSQLLQLFPRWEFQRRVQESRAERHARGFTCWGQFVAMLFCQLGRAQSLREICDGLASCEGKLAHLGITRPSRSTLAYANAHRPWELYQQIFLDLLERCRQQGPLPKKFRFRNKLLSLDATVIDLCASVFDWARFRRSKGAVKIHMVLDHEGYLPHFAVITEGAVHESRIASTLQFDAGTIVVMDRGFTDYRLYHRWTEEGVFLVSRLKSNADYGVAEDRLVPERGSILQDQIIFWKSPRGHQDCPQFFRRIEVLRPETGDVLVLLTNHLTLGATTIARIYKDRWQIELFFKALKQNLKVKTFVGTSANALKIQIWTALIAILMLKFLQLRSQWGWHLSNLSALLRLNLFTHRNLWHWIDHPLDAPPGTVPLVQQLEFSYR